MTYAFIALTIVLAVLMAAAGGAKLAGVSSMREAAAHLGIAWDSYRLIGVLEIFAVVGLVAGLFWGWIGVAAGAGAVLLMLGALAFHRRSHDKLGQSAAAIVVLGVSVAYVAVASANLI